jgi:hypothetical protein
LTISQGMAAAGSTSALASRRSSSHPCQSSIGTGFSVVSRLSQSCPISSRRSAMLSQSILNGRRA